MNEPLVEGDRVLVLWVLTRPGPRGFISGLFGTSPTPIYIGHRVRRAVVSSSVIDGVVQARELWFGHDLRPLTPEGEGISWCRGWSREARDALSVAWTLWRAKAA